MADSTHQPAPNKNATPTSHKTQIRDDTVVTHNQEPRQRHHHDYNEHETCPRQANEDEDDENAQQVPADPPLQHAADINAVWNEPPDTELVRIAVSRKSESDWLWSSAKQAEQERLIRCTVLDLEQQEGEGFPASHGRLPEWTEEQYNVEYWHRQRQRSDDWADLTSDWTPGPGKATGTGGNDGWDSGWGDAPDFERSYRPEDWDMPIDGVTEEEHGRKKAGDRIPAEDSGEGDHSGWR